MNRICRTCEREITAELFRLDGGDDVVDMAGVDPDPTARDPDERQSALLEATIRLSCSCSSLDVDTEGTVTPLSSFVPDEWGEMSRYVESVSVQEDESDG